MLKIFSYVIFWLVMAFVFAIIAMIIGGEKLFMMLAIVSLLVALGIAEYKGSKMS